MTSTHPAVGDPAEGDLEADFLAKAVRYVSWPERSFSSATAPIVIGVVGKDGFADAIRRRFAGMKAATRSYQVRSIAAAEDVTGVHMLVLTETRARALKKLARMLRDEEVLSVARSLTFAEEGGVLGLEVLKGKVAFEVNNDTATKGDIKISSRLLQLASNVY